MAGFVVFALVNNAPTIKVIIKNVITLNQKLSIE